jgi:hypothetical protein
MAVEWIYADIQAGAFVKTESPGRLRGTEKIFDNYSFSHVTSWLLGDGTSCDFEAC